MTRRFILLDGLRGVAAFGVISYHYAALNSGFAGRYSALCVDFFFVLSGFVLYPKLIQNNRTSFLTNRIIRLWPMLIPIFLTVITIERIPILHKIFGGEICSWTFLILAFLLIPMSYSGSRITTFWSLAAEWFINLSAVFFLPKIKFNVKIVIGVVSICLISEFFLLGILQGNNNPRGFLGTTIVRNLLGILRVSAGFFSGYILRFSLKNGDRYLIRLPFIIVLTVIFVTLLTINNDLLLILDIPISYLLVGAVSQIDESKIHEGLLRLSSYLGRISYGIYVWHGPLGSLKIGQRIIGTFGSYAYPLVFVRFFGVLLNVLLVILVTEFTIRFIERPIRQLLII